MSLSRILLLEFNPNQLSLIDDTPDAKIKKSLTKLVSKLSSHPDQSMSKQDVLDMFDINGETVERAIESNLDVWTEDIYELSRYDPTTLRDIVDDYYYKLGDNIFDFEELSDWYNSDHRERLTADDKNELIDYFEENDHLMEEWEFIESTLKDEYINNIERDFLRQHIKANGERFFDALYDIVDDNVETIYGTDCLPAWRAITVSLDDEYPLHPDKGVGEYWSYVREGAEPHGGGRGSVSNGIDIILHGWLPLGNIDWDATFYKTFWRLNEEQEIETYDNVEVFIEKIEIEEGNESLELRNKADLIAKTYFKTKLERLSTAEKYRLVNQIAKYLKENNKVSPEYSIKFDNYYKTQT